MHEQRRFQPTRITPDPGLPVGTRWLAAAYLLVLGIAGVVVGAGQEPSSTGWTLGFAGAAGALLTVPVLTAAAFGWWRASFGARLALLVAANGLEMGWVGLNYLAFHGRTGGESLSVDWIFAWPLGLFAMVLPFVVVTRVTGWRGAIPSEEVGPETLPDEAPLSLAGVLLGIAVLAVCLGLLQRAEGEWGSGARPWAVAAACAGWGLALMPLLASLLTPAGWVRRWAALVVAAAGSWGWWVVISGRLADPLPLVWGSAGFLGALALPVGAIRWGGTASGRGNALR